MDSDEDFELFPSSPSPVHERKLKRLKKATTVDKFGNDENLEDSILGSDNSCGEELVDSIARSETPKGVTVTDDALGAKRVLEFDSLVEEQELDGKVDSEEQELDRKVDSEEQELDEKVDSEEQELDGKIDSEEQELDGKVTEKSEEVGDPKNDESERKRRSLDVSSEKQENKKKKKRINDGDGSEKKPKESVSYKRKSEKERRENLKNLRAESQRLLRETRDAAFKPVPLVQKPISSILDKIRQRKLEISKKSYASFDDDDDLLVHEDITSKVQKVVAKETPATCPAATNSNLNASDAGGSKDAEDDSSSERIASPTAMGSEPEHAFRAPVGDTQDLFSDSQSSDAKEEAANEKSNNPSEEVSAPSMLAMNLKFDSAPPDDDVSSDDEENDKENMDPHLHGSIDLTLAPSGDPVKAFVDEEAEEEDDSDNDLQRFQDNEEECEDDDDIEELNDIIATEYEEKPVDREKRDQLHQKWLEQQDTAGMDNLLQKLNCASKLKESISIEEEDEESKETENESDDEAEEYIAPSEAGKINLKKMKQMIPQMFTDKDDAYVSSDDEDSEERLVKQSLFYKVEEKAKFCSPAEDESSKDVFSLIKKLNTVPDNKRKGRTSSIFDMLHTGQNINISSKSSFVGRASNHFMRTSQKNGSSKVRSFIFGRDDSNSRNSVSVSEDSSDTIQRESQPPKPASAKFQRNTQNKYTSNSTSEKSNVSLLEILRRSSLHAEQCVQNAKVQQTESVFDAFKLAKKPVKTEARV